MGCALHDQRLATRSQQPALVHPELEQHELHYRDQLERLTDMPAGRTHELARYGVRGLAIGTIDIGESRRIATRPHVLTVDDEPLAVRDDLVLTRAQDGLLAAEVAATGVQHPAAVE